MLSLLGTVDVLIDAPRDEERRDAVVDLVGKRRHVAHQPAIDPFDATVAERDLGVADDDEAASETGGRHASLGDLAHLVGEAVEIYVNDRLVARGEIVLVENRLGVTMTEIIKAA